MDKKKAPEIIEGEELDESVEGHAAVNFRPLDTGPQADRRNAGETRKTRHD